MYENQIIKQFYIACEKTNEHEYKNNYAFALFYMTKMNFLPFEFFKK